MPKVQKEKTYYRNSAGKKTSQTAANGGLLNSLNSKSEHTSSFLRAIGNEKLKTLSSAVQLPSTIDSIVSEANDNNFDHLSNYNNLSKKDKRQMRKDQWLSSESLVT
jgi:hypothetical protein